MKINRLIKTTFISLILSAILFCNYSFAEDNSNLQIYSDSAILIEKETGKILYAKNSDKKMYPASTTKILTAIIAIEKLSLDEKITASYDAIMAIPPGYSNAAIQVGETLTAKELLQVFLVHSANEAGFILAEHISGSFSSFADLMNEKAKEIGCLNTHFTNPSGLQDENHYTTAYDLALIARYCMSNDTFRSIVSMESCTIPATDKYEERFFRNTNEMLYSKSQYYNENIIGIKTGYTSQALNCLIAGFKNDDMELISVVLGASASVGDKNLSGKYTDTKTLFDYGAQNFRNTKILSAGDVITNTEVKHAASDSKNVDLIVQKNVYDFINTSINIDEITPEIKLNDNIVAPITKNSILGTITYNIDGVSYTSNLVAKNDVRANEVFENFLKLIFAVLIIFIIYKLMYNSKNKKNGKKNKKKKKSNENFTYGRVKY